MFSKETFDFLMENRLRDSKDWFEAHRQEYERVVRGPLRGLSAQLAPTLLGIDGQLVTEPRGVLSRIRRDTRFSKDKSLYRDVAWCVFTRSKREYAGCPGFFFEVSPGGWRYGCGYYQADTALLEQARALILQGNRAFAAALAAYQGQDVFQQEGDFYKRSRHPDEPPALRDWLDRKNICFIHNGANLQEVCTPDLAQRLAAGFSLLAPMYRFLLLAEESRRRADG